MKLLLILAMGLFFMVKKQKEIAYYPTIKNLRDTKFKNIQDLSLVFAIIEQESSFNPAAINKEGQDDPQKYSWGLMQIRYATAKDRGYPGTAQDLIKADVNLYYGMAQLSWLLKNAPSLEIAISGYNAGLTGAVKYGRSVVYRTSVLKRMAKWRQILTDANLPR